MAVRCRPGIHAHDKKHAVTGHTMYVTPLVDRQWLLPGDWKGTGHIVAWASPRFGGSLLGGYFNLMYGASDTQPGFMAGLE